LASGIRVRQMKQHAVAVDPERHEIDLLLGMAPELQGAAVLEVGCGDGRLTRLYAPVAGRVTAIDPNAVRIEAARAGSALPNVEYRQAGIEGLAASEREFDVGILAWSL